MKTDKINIAVFAHNEQNNIIRCLNSICDSTSNRSLLNVNVLVNGSTDGTFKLVSEFCDSNTGFTCTHIELGDKSNAWNEYIYSQHDDGLPHYFLDGDNWLPARSLDYISQHWDYESSTALATMPIGVSEGLRNMLRHNKWISGNFYGLSPNFLNEIKSRDFRIPIGFIGEDSLITYLLESGMENDSSKSYLNKRKNLVTVLDATGPVIPKISPTLDSIRMLHNRYKRYAIRHFQQEVFYHLARTDGLESLPSNARELKEFLKDIGLKPYLSICGIQTMYHPYAVFKMLIAK